MKPLLCFFVCFTVVAAYAQTSEETTIRQLIEAETNAFSQMAFADVAKKFWIVDDHTYMCVNKPGDYHFVLRKEDFITATAFLPQDKVIVEHTGHEFIINGNMASVFFNQTITTPETGDKQYSHEIRILEKGADGWRIHCSSIHYYIPK
jgi:hypothetical protein